jgi:heat-inducible transcriptional repressor
LELSEREKNILRCVIQNFVLTANPVGSRVISKKYELGLSPATIRNVMSDLESMGLIYHPHTSAGRVPTDKGYRLYVDLLMDTPYLSASEKKSIEKEIASEIDSDDDILKAASNILGEISSQLAMVSYPSINKSVLEKIQLVILPHNVLMVILSLKSGIIRTISLEFSLELKLHKLEQIQNVINERITGLTLLEIRNTFSDRFKDLKNEKTGVLRLFLNSVEKIFAEEKEAEKIHISGMGHILKSPEFKSAENIQGIIELVEDKEIILHILDRAKDVSDDEIMVTIGAENIYERLNDYSLITATYKSGDAQGVLGMIGPRRMNYSRMIAIVGYMSKMLTEVLSRKMVDPHVSL